MNIQETDEVKLQPYSFYLEQMQRVIDMADAGETAKLANPIFSFFHGNETTDSAVMVSSGHVMIFIESKEMQAYLRINEHLLLRWIEIIYFYFQSMAAVPALARELWMTCWGMLDMFEKFLGFATFGARSQMGYWAESYDEEKKKLALSHITKMKPASYCEKAQHELFLSTKINEADKDFVKHVNNAYRLSKYLPPLQQLQAHIVYFTKVTRSAKVFAEILSFLKSKNLAQYKAGKMSFLTPLIWTLVNENMYDNMLTLQRSLKNFLNVSDVGVSHAFILTNDSRYLPALTKSELITFEDQDNGKSYKNLIRLCNRLNNVSVSLLGDDDLAHACDKLQFGAPANGGDFEELRQAVINHYHLLEGFYEELQLYSLIPSHIHPLQGALCTLGVTPPVLSVSLNALADEPAIRKSVFFLSSNTYTYSMEMEWITKEFGSDAFIVTDPATEEFSEALSDNANTHIYISAHGKYSHWEDEEEEIFFSETSRIPVSVLHKLKMTSSLRRTVILNICDGAASPISFNANNRGLAAQMASSNQVVISHLWPVNPLYAAAFGMVTFKGLQTRSASEAVLFSVSILRESNRIELVKNVKDLGISFNKLAETLENSSYEISDFRNIGSIAIYG